MANHSKAADNPNWRGGPQPATCLICNKTFLIARWELRRKRGGRKYCSRECYGKSISEFRSGESAHGWKGGRLLHEGRVLVQSSNHPRAQQRGYVFEHILVAERALGKFLPSGAVVHHVDSVPSNNENNNLVICQNQAYHMLIHSRTRILRMGGHPDRDGICSQCHMVKPKLEFYPSKGSTGHRCNCRACQTIYYANKKKSKETL